LVVDTVFVDLPLRELPVPCPAHGVGKVR
jgi:hypothetical protein